MTEFFRNIDIFACPINLTMKKNYAYKSSFGGGMTLVLISLMLALAVYSLIRLFEKKEMYVNQYQVNLKKEYGNIDLSDANFMIALQFYDDRLNNWTKPFMNLSLIHMVQYRNETTYWRDKTYINLRPCQEKDFRGYEADYEKLNLKTALCPDSKFNASIEGDFTENVFAYLQISLSACLDPLVCQDQETINSVLSKMGLKKSNIIIKKIFFF